jgi:hypothetical protein
MISGVHLSSYWAWTHQEIVLANQETSIVRLGGEEMPWAKVMDAVVFICTHRRPPVKRFFLDPLRLASNMHVFAFKALAVMLGVNRPDWVYLLCSAIRYDCSDDRDRLYALRGLLDPEMARSIRVDYSKSAKQIVASACVTHLEQRRNLHFLKVCNSFTSPTWAADLQRPLDALHVLSDAGARSAASARLVKSGVLEVAGVPCDEITSNPIDLPATENFESLQEYIANLITAFRDLTGNDDFHQDDKCLDELMTVMSFGGLWDYSAVRT